MLRFLRTLRHRMLAENRVSKYLLYAVGEILLVVIGILIALQVNNWNTARTEENDLDAYLRTIAQNIQSDLPVIEALKARRDSVRANAQEYWRMSQKEHFGISDARRLAGSIITAFEVENFNGNQSGFESLKTSGLLGKIKGTGLAESLFEYYRQASVINNLVDHANTYSQAMQIELMKQDFTPVWAGINGNIGTHIRDTSMIDPIFMEASQTTLKTVARHPTVIALMARHASDYRLVVAYEEIHQMGGRIIQDIEGKLQSN